MSGVCSSKEDELAALWSWLQSFPQVALTKNKEKFVLQSNIKNDEVDGGGQDKQIENSWINDEQLTSAILSVAEEIFDATSPSILNESTVERTWFQISTLAGLDIKNPKYSENQPLHILRAMLRHAVSENNAHRQEYILQIVELAKTATAGNTLNILKGIIQQTKQASCMNNDDVSGVSSDSECDDDYHNDTENISKEDCSKSLINKEKDEKTIVDNTISITPHKIRRTRDDTIHADVSSPVRKKRSSYSSKNVKNMCTSPYIHGRGNVMQMRKNGDEKMDVVHEALREQVEKLRNREDELTNTLEESKAKHHAQVLRLETETRDREQSALENYERQISELRLDLDKANACKYQAEKAIEENLTLKDELDVLQQSEKKLQSTEDHLRKCKDKIQELVDVKEQLSREESAHGNAMSQILKLENELAQMLPLRRQLDSYKVRTTAAEVKFTQCEDELQKLRSEHKKLCNSNKELADVSKFQNSQTQDLRKLLEDETKMTGNDLESHGIGDGMSELNPELMEEILRLRNENKVLKDFAAKREDDAVEKLEEDLDDSGRLAESYKSEFLAKKHALEKTEKSLSCTEMRNEELSNDITALTDKCNCLEKRVQDEIQKGDDARIAADKNLQNTKTILTDKAELEKARLEKTASDILTAERETSKSEIANITCKLEKVIKENTTKVRQLETTHQDQTEKKNVENQRTVEELKFSHEAEVAKNLQRLEECCLKSEAKITSLTKHAEIERVEYIEMGKEMMTSVQASNEKDKKEVLSSQQSKYDTELNELKAQHKIVVTSMASDQSNIMKQQESYEQKMKGKLLNYKRRLNISECQLKTLENELEEVHERRKRLEQEKLKMKEENERFCRQVRSKVGTESNMSAQLESLQREYNDILAENRALKRRGPTMLQCDDRNESYNYGGGEISGSTMSHVRGEYDKTIQKLNDERRELVMRNSAAISDLQKAEQRCFKLNDEKAQLEGKITHMELHIQRLERRQGVKKSNDATESKKLFHSDILPHGRPPISTTNSPIGKTSNEHSKAIHSRTDKLNTAIRVKRPSNTLSSKQHINLKERIAVSASRSRPSMRNVNVRKFSSANGVENIADPEPSFSYKEKNDLGGRSIHSGSFSIRSPLKEKHQNTSLLSPSFSYKEKNDSGGRIIHSSNFSIRSPLKEKDQNTSLLSMENSYSGKSPKIFKDVKKKHIPSLVECLQQGGDAAEGQQECQQS